MTTWVYQTPNKKYGIQKIDSPFDGLDISEYVICKYDCKLSRWDGFYIFGPEQKLKDCFDWLLKNKLISQEEMKLHESLCDVALDSNRVMW